MDQFLQHVANALVLGGNYAVLGIGLTLIFGIMRVVNFAHGEIYALGGYSAYVFTAVLGLNFYLALLLAVAVGLLFGAIMEFALLRRIRNADMDTGMLVTIGSGIVMLNAIQLFFGGVAKSVPTPFSDEPFDIGPISLSHLRVFVLVATVGLIVLTYALINRTRLGSAMRATFQDADAAALMGVSIGSIYTATFAIGAALAAAAGALLGPVFLISPTMGNAAALKAFAVVILGGLGSIPGATIGGLIVAFAEEFGAAYVSSGYRDAIGFVIIAVVLLVKPTGLFSRVERVG
jgi:branched-chain amino acid transport system permease protein